METKNAERKKYRMAMPKGKWLEPEEAFEGLFGRIPDNCRTAMVATFVAGLITHMFFLVNKLPNGDDLSELYHYNSMITSGRWLDIVSKGMTSYYSLPWASGLVCLVLMGISVALICSLAGLKRKPEIIAAAAIFATFPTMASYFSYLYYMDLYMLTLLFNVWAVWLAWRKTWGFIPGALLIALGLGNYQAYMGVAAVLSLFVLARECLGGEKSIKRIVIVGLRLLIMGMIGLALYFFILQGIVSYLSLDLSDYQGIAGMGTGAMDASAIWRYTRDAYGGFTSFFYNDRFFTSPMVVKCIYSLLLVLTFLWILVALYRRFRQGGRAESAGRILLFFLFAGVLPVAYNLIFFMAPDAFLHSLMQPQYALFWLMPMMFYELAYPAKDAVKHGAAKQGALRQGASGSAGKVSWFQGITRWLLLGSLAGLVYFFFLTVNISYLHLHLKYEITYATELRILDRIESLPDYQTDTPVCVVGAFPNEYVSLYPYHTQDVVKGLVGINGNLVHHYYNYNGFFKNYLGRQMNFLREDDERKADILTWPEVEGMPVWPREGSVSMINGVVIVKIDTP